MKKEKTKQIILSALAFCLIGLGYLNYSYNSEDSVDVAAEASNVNVGDAQLVNSEPDLSIVPNNSNDTSVEENKNDYFTKTKLERDIMYSEMITTYQKMIDSPEIAQNQKAIAAQELTDITNIKNAIMISENLIKNKDFEDVVILVNKNIINVIVKSTNLNTEQVAKIQNIVTRELNAKIENVSISNKY